MAERIERYFRGIKYAFSTRHYVDRRIAEIEREREDREYQALSEIFSNILNGRESDNAIMQELQRRAMLNKDAELNAYSPERMQKVIQKLKS
jgi:hypothetical protein